MTEKTDIEKLRILLAHWIDHNHSHETEMNKWQKAALDADQGEAATYIKEATTAMQATDKALAKALEALGGPMTDHHHHHH